tara:strand:+ start:67091 stop:68149 length:1059 start_codon:yes stop_codon:yes gene_type:complete
MKPNYSDIPSVFVVLATWNGGKYVAAQIESILAQTESDWTLLIRDDGSIDETPSILANYGARDQRIELLQDARGRLGPAQSFGVLIRTALDRGADYVCLADQDDVWDPSKVADQLQQMLETEQEHGVDCPALIYSDMVVTDHRLEILQPSFNQVEKPPVDAEQFLRGLLTRNYVPGCTIMVNRALLQFSLPLPLIEMMHDHWLTLCAASTGVVRCIQRPLLQYRRHGDCATPTGLNRSSLFAMLRRLCQGEPLSTEVLKRRWASIEAARIILQRLSPHLGRSTLLLDGFCRAFLPGTTVIQRVSMLRRLGLPVGGWFAKSLVYYIQICCLKTCVENAGNLEEKTEPQVRTVA